MSIYLCQLLSKFIIVRKFLFNILFQVSVGHIMWLYTWIQDRIQPHTPYQDVPMPQHIFLKEVTSSSNNVLSTLSMFWVRRIFNKL